VTCASLPLAAMAQPPPKTRLPLEQVAVVVLDELLLAETTVTLSQPVTLPAVVAGEATGPS